MSLDDRLLEVLRQVAPGTALRPGLERILRANTGALVVLGSPPQVEALFTGGFQIDVPFTAQRLSELAKMDGALVLDETATRILWANVHLMPDPAIPTVETGTRHRTAERVARQTARSAAGSVILTPPAVAANTSLPARPMRALRSSTATRMASRPASRPCAVRRGTATPVGTTSAWTSVTSGRRPSRLTVQATPGTPAERADRNSRDGSARPTRPSSVISKQPTS